MPSDRLLPKRIQDHLETARFGRRLYYMRDVDSTNRVAMQLAKDGEEEGTLVITDFQTHGRGRFQRTWSSPPETNLLFSLILRPHMPLASVLPMTLAFSLSLADTLALVLGAPTGVKWPNDVYAGDGKIGGMLSESSVIAGRADHVVVGIGVNVNMRADAGVPGMASCYTVTGHEHDRAEVLARILVDLEATYGTFGRHGFEAFVRPYDERMKFIGRRIRFSGAGRSGHGVILGVRQDGGLQVDTGRGSPEVLYNEETTLDDE
jgi:BirA family biotin operon repressor/biotin-[acetyl-CoA-carboxylase] ligase